ncbi:MAG: hypothetical protein HYX76_14730 [Acidobacteria bacterium]|nr:hypothetical protein [Acidobacteriota bacterium]
MKHELLAVAIAGALMTSPLPVGQVSTTALAHEAPDNAFREVRVPAGTVLSVVLDSTVGSATSRVEDPVKAHVRRAIVIGGREVVPAGSTVTGIVTHSKRSGRVKGLAEVAFRFTSLRAQGEIYRIRTGSVRRRAPATRRKDAATIGLPAAGGAVVGAIAGGKKGAAVGTAVGGGAGTAVVLSTRGKEVIVPAGRAVAVKLLQPITVRVRVR